FQVKKESFTSLRIRIPYEPSNGIPYESSSTLDKTAKPVKLKPRSAFETNAFCIELAITGVAENLRSCKKLEHVDLIPKRSLNSLLLLVRSSVIVLFPPV